MWWMVYVGFSHVLDEENLTPTQEKCLDLDIQATNILFRSLHNCILGEIMDKETAHEIWSYLNEKYGAPSDDHDDYKTKEEVHERMMSTSMTWWLWKIAPPHGQMMMMIINLQQVHLT